MKVGDLVTTSNSRIALIVDKRIAPLTRYAAPIGGFFSSKSFRESEIMMIKCLWADTNTTSWVRYENLEVLNPT